MSGIAALTLVPPSIRVSSRQKNETAAQSDNREGQNILYKCILIIFSSVILFFCGKQHLKIAICPSAWRRRVRLQLGEVGDGDLLRWLDGECASASA
jgi:hypothetical protein